MLRRTYLRALAGLSAFPFVPGRLDPTPEKLPADGQLMFWYHFRQAVVTDQGMSTEQSRKTIVEDMDLTRCSRNEAKQALELAHNGYYSLDTVPEKWREYFDRVDRVDRKQVDTT